MLNKDTLYFLKYL